MFVHSGRCLALLASLVVMGAVLDTFQYELKGLNIDTA